ncbi:MAG TPA: potassium channel family protein [Chloroflexota bacterium]|nr:potassium channel family protein [Chloroflexota bacterium]
MYILPLILALVGAILIVVVLWEAFETIILPRRIVRSRRFTALFYRLTWRPWASLARRISNEERRETYLSFFGPLSLIVLVGLWALVLILGFSLLHWGLSTNLIGPEGREDLAGILYYSGVTFFTLGYGDIAPRDSLGRIVAVWEAGTGFAFLALIIGYLPDLAGTFARREVNVSILDARAGSPPSAIELLRRYVQDDDLGSLKDLLAEWERWSADLLESHLSYPVLAYFRSQHERQSWVAALTTVLDTCAIVMAFNKGPSAAQARLTFAMARHAAGDLGQIFRTRMTDQQPSRQPPPLPSRLHAILGASGFARVDDSLYERLSELRGYYEPSVDILSRHLLMPLPTWEPAETVDIWRTTAWGYDDEARSELVGR